MTVYFEIIKQNDLRRLVYQENNGLSNNVRQQNYIQIAVDANNHGNQKYSELYQNDFNTWLKVLGIVSNEIYRYCPSLLFGRYLSILYIVSPIGYDCGFQYNITKAYQSLIQSFHSFDPNTAFV